MLRLEMVLSLVECMHTIPVPGSDAQHHIKSVLVEYIYDMIQVLRSSRSYFDIHGLSDHPGLHETLCYE